MNKPPAKPYKNYLKAKTPQKMTDAEKLMNRAVFLNSVPRVTLGPADAGFEVAFAGRSNAGKSSAINAMTRHNGLARTSKTPGRTQHLVYFELTPDWRLVDLPGYGYAKVALKARQQWGQAIEEYLTTRQALIGMVLLMDIRHPITELDAQFIHWSTSRNMPLLILLTKADKLKRGAAKSTLLQVQKSLADATNITVQMFSSLKNEGVADACEHVAQWFEHASVTSSANQE